jgi:hypothetical protein
MTTVTFTLPSVASVTSADWGAAFHRWAKAIAAVLVVPYVAGLMAGEAWHRLVAWANTHHLAGLARLGLLGAPTDHFPAATKMVVQCLAPAPAPSIGIAQPRANAVEMMAAGGMSQRAIAKALKISRHRVKAMLG